jgi:hypothetical protein
LKNIVTPSATVKPYSMRWGNRGMGPSHFLYAIMVYFFAILYGKNFYGSNFLLYILISERKIHWDIFGKKCSLISNSNYGGSTMKTLTTVILIPLMILSLTSCGFSRFAKDTPKPEAAVVEQDQAIYVKIPVAQKRTLRTILDDMLASGELVNKDIHGRKFGDHDYTWEMLVIREQTGDVQAAVIEDGELILIAPVNDLEQARSKYKPYGGWKD